MGRECFMGTDSVWEDGKVLEKDGGDGCTTVWTYLIPLNCALKMVKMVNVMWLLPRFFLKSALFYCQMSGYIGSRCLGPTSLGI